MRRHELRGFAMFIVLWWIVLFTVLPIGCGHRTTKMM